MDTVEDDEHLEFFHKDTTFRDRVRYQTNRVAHFVRVVVDARAGPLVARCRRTSSRWWSDGNVLRATTVALCLVLVASFSALWSRRVDAHALRHAVPSDDALRPLESPLTLMTEYLGPAPPGIDDGQSFSSTSTFSSLTGRFPKVEDRSWFVAGREHPPDGIRLSPMMEHNLVDTDTPWRASFVPLFWHVPRSAGGSVKEMISSCLNLIQASDAGAKGHENDEVLEVVFVKGGNDGGHPHRYVNVDTMRMPGIQRAKNLGLVENELARVVTTLYVQDVPVLFNPQHKGQLFTIFRHPVERSVSLFRYLRSSYESERYLPPDATLDDYARSPRLEFNWTTRFLTGRLVGELTQEHADVAKTILRRKVIVGLLEEKEETMRRFAASFHWTKRIGPREQTCLNDLLNGGDWPNRQRYPGLSENSRTWFLLEEKNQFDMQLYYYAKMLFEQQSVLFR